MKKTLAAVLAAAMALSTATVAFARDTMEGETILENLSTVGTRQTIAKGKEYSFFENSNLAPARSNSFKKFIGRRRICSEASSRYSPRENASTAGRKRATVPALPT